MQKQAKSLPVVTYHYVNYGKASLTISPDLFEQHCKILADNGWRGIGLDEAEEFFLTGKSLPAKSVLLTFDDGYLDNYVYAWPILQKYRHKAVIFATAGLVTEAQKKLLPHEGQPRHTLQDVWNGTIDNQLLPPVDCIHQKNQFGTVVYNQFFSWDEARLMEKSGTIAIGGHSLFHDGVFTSADYTGFTTPGDSRVSLNKEVKDGFWGRPCFPRGPFFVDRAFLPSPDLLQDLREMVPQDEKEAFDFLKKESSVKRLESVMKKHQKTLGRMESDEEWNERVHNAMQQNQKLLTKELGHPVRSFCWPWGKSSELALKAGQAAGFSVFYDVVRGPNRGNSPVGVRRMNYRTDAEKLLSRVATYSHPLWGEVYELLRSVTRRFQKMFCR